MSFDVKNLWTIVNDTWSDELLAYKTHIPRDRCEYIENVLEGTQEWERKIMTYMEEYEETNYLIYNLLKLIIELKLNEEQQ
jgi:hypothetical protein